MDERKEGWVPLAASEGLVTSVFSTSHLNLWHPNPKKKGLHRMDGTQGEMLLMLMLMIDKAKRGERQGGKRRNGKPAIGEKIDGAAGCGRGRRMCE